MERYRVNYLLLGILAISSLVLSGAAYGLWSYQIDRNATRLLERADANEAEGELLEARRNLEQYIRLRRDDDEARIRLATVANEIASGDNATPDDMKKAYSLVNDTVSRTEDPQLTRDLIELHLRYGRPQDALQTVEVLLEEQPDNPELLTLKARCLYFSKDYNKFSRYANELIGYDTVTGEFDAEAAKAPHEIDVYALLVNYLVTIEHDEKLTNLVIDQLVAANPENFKAHLLHYEIATQQLRRETARTERETETLKQVVEKSPDKRSKDRAQKDLEEKEKQFAADLKDLENSAEASLAKAYELAPEEESVLLAKGQDFVEKEEYDKAIEFFERGKKKFPENVNFDFRLAQCYISKEDFDQAQKILST